jgi:hypothetical protein
MRIGGLAVLAMVASVVLAEGPDPRQTYLEKKDDGPGAFRAVDDPLARSPGFEGTVGSYTSVQVNVDSLGQNIVGDAANEPSLAVNPVNPQNMVIGWRQFDTITSNFRQAGNAYTTNGGANWSFLGPLTPGIFRSDPVLDFDSAGNVYYHSLIQSFDIDLFTSTDGGLSWGAPVFAYGGDKNWMVVDRSGGTGDGHIYGTWRAVFGCCGNDMLNRSTDGGQSFEFPVDVPQQPGVGTMAVGPDGELYVAGVDESQGFDTFVVGKSTNAQNPGATPSFTTTEVPMNGELGAFDGPNPSGLLGQVNVAVDPSDGPGRGNVYVMASVDQDAPGTNPIDVLLSRSSDGGATWSAPIRVNDDAANSGAWHWMAALSAAPNGRLDAIWNDTRASGQLNVAELFYAYSWDGGDTWSENIAVSPPFDSFVGWPQQNKIGDYYTIRSDETGAGAAYSATFNGEQDVYYIRLFPDCNENGISDVTDIAGASADCNGNRIPDECEADVESCGAAGAVPNGGLVQGTPLLLHKLPGSLIRLTWQASRRPVDANYGIYEGTIGDFAGHTINTCDTGGQTSAEFFPAPESSYYLVVPLNDENEGSYGRATDGPRPAAAVPCVPQDVGPCPGSPGG